MKSENGNIMLVAAVVIAVIVYGMYLVSNPSGSDVFTWAWAFIAGM